MSALAQELQARGHRCTFLLVPDFEEKIRSTGVGFCPIAQSEYPLGSWPLVLQRLGMKAGLDNLGFTIDAYRKEVQAICRDVPTAIERLGIDALLVDQSEPAGGTVAELLGIPFITVCLAVLLDQEDEVPPAVFDWPFREGWLARLRNRAGFALLNRISQPIWQTLMEQRRTWGLPTLNGYNDTSSKLAQISQQPEAFEFPRQKISSSLHFCGPLRRPGAIDQQSVFPYEQLNGKLLVYGSLGTLQGRKSEIFQMMAAACESLPVQLVIAHGGNLDERTITQLPGDPIALPWVPQLDLLSRVSVCITHCGMNTVLDALSNGVPMVGLPQVHDQPGIASRIDWSHTGIVFSPAKQTLENLSRAISNLIEDDSYRKSAQKVAQSIRASGGVSRAADICESVLSPRQPERSS
jgi:zeaxanthin glucosyltransferase